MLFERSSSNSSDYKWYLPTLTEILVLSQPVTQKTQSIAQQRVRAEQEWCGAIAALNQLLQQAIEADVQPSQDGVPAIQGVLLSGPVPVLESPELVRHLATWTLTVSSPEERLKLPAASDLKNWRSDTTPPVLPLLSSDPLASEQFCVALTTEFSLAMVLGETADGNSAFLFSFEPEVVRQVWRSIQARLKLASVPALPLIDPLVEQFAPIAPDYRTVMQFTRLMLANLPQEVVWDADRPVYQVRPEVSQVLQGAAANLKEQVPPRSSRSKQRKSHSTGKAAAKPVAKRVQKQSMVERILPSRMEPTTAESEASQSYDAELLQAIAHEVRTPLTTIRTLTRLLLKRKDLNPDVLKRLEIIDRECTEQIDRFSLIFKAVEIETAKNRNSLTALSPISLSQVLQQNVSRWEQQASQHNHTLEVSLPQKLPMVVTDAAMLDQALTGLIDRFTHSLPPGSHIQVKVSLAGHQLKLQFESHPEEKGHGDGKTKFSLNPGLKSIGQLLMFQPETGNLSLNMNATKNLFQALGGKLIVRQHPQQGEVLTIFLPLETW